MILLLLCIFPSAYQVVILYICKYLLVLYIYRLCPVPLYEGLVAARCLLFTFKFCKQRATKGRKRKGRGELRFDKSLYSKVLCMFRLIRSGDYRPDLSAIDRVVQMAGWCR